MFGAVEIVNQNHKPALFLRNWPQTFFLPPGFFLTFIRFRHRDGTHLDPTGIEMASRWSPLGAHLLIGTNQKKYPERQQHQKKPSAKNVLQFFFCTLFRSLVVLYLKQTRVEQLIYKYFTQV
jgi:hypothetical protein